MKFQYQALDQWKEHSKWERPVKHTQGEMPTPQLFKRHKNIQIDFQEQDGPLLKSVKQLLQQNFQEEVYRKQHPGTFALLILENILSIEYKVKSMNKEKHMSEFICESKDGKPVKIFTNNQKYMNTDTQLLIDPKQFIQLKEDIFFLL